MAEKVGLVAGNQEPGGDDLADEQISAPLTLQLTPAQQRVLEDALAEAKHAYCFVPNSYTYGTLQAVLALVSLLGFTDRKEGGPC